MVTVLPAETTIVMVNFHSEALLAPLASRFSAEGIRTIVADNSRTCLVGSFGVDVITMTSNLGFGAACNAAMKRVESPTAVLVNPDVAASPLDVSRLVGELASRTAAGAVAPTLRVGRRVLPQGYAYPSLGRELGAALPRLRYAAQIARRRIRRPAISPRFESPTRRFGSAACVALDVSAFRAIGGFDEDFFLYVEDCDLWHRLRLAGYEVGFLSSVVVDHASASGSPAARPVREVLRWVGVQLFVETHGGASWRSLRRLHQPLVERHARQGSAIARTVLRSWGRSERPREVSRVVANEIRLGRLPVT